MKKWFSLLFLALALPAVPVLAEPGSEQGQVRKDTRSGAVLSSRQIEQRVLPKMKGWEYFGFGYDPVAMIYRLRFVRQGRAVDVDVDARSGAIVGQSR